MNDKQSITIAAAILFARYNNKIPNYGKAREIEVTNAVDLAADIFEETEKSFK